MSDKLLSFGPLLCFRESDNGYTIGFKKERELLGVLNNHNGVFVLEPFTTLTLQSVREILEALEFFNKLEVANGA